MWPRWLLLRTASPMRAAARPPRRVARADTVVLILMPLHVGVFVSRGGFDSHSRSDSGRRFQRRR